jgi:hypothetical protein
MGRGVYIHAQTAVVKGKVGDGAGFGYKLIGSGRQNHDPAGTAQKRYDRLQCLSYPQWQGSRENIFRGKRVHTERCEVDYPGFNADIIAAMEAFDNMSEDARFMGIRDTNNVSDLNFKI